MSDEAVANMQTNPQVEILDLNLKIAALEAELAALKGAPTQSDRDAARQILDLTVLCPFKEDHDRAAEIIAALIRRERVQTKAFYAQHLSDQLNERAAELRAQLDKESGNG